MSSASDKLPRSRRNGEMMIFKDARLHQYAGTNIHRVSIGTISLVNVANQFLRPIYLGNLYTTCGLGLPIACACERTRALPLVSRYRWPAEPCPSGVFWWTGPSLSIKFSGKVGVFGIQNVALAGKWAQNHFT